MPEIGSGRVCSAAGDPEGDREITRHARTKDTVLLPARDLRGEELERVLNRFFEGREAAVLVVARAAHHSVVRGMIHRECDVGRREDSQRAER